MLQKAADPRHWLSAVSFWATSSLQVSGRWQSGGHSCWDSVPRFGEHKSDTAWKLLLSVEGDMRLSPHFAVITHSE